LRDAAAGRFDVVVVADIDRLTRSEDLGERGAILGALQRAGVCVASAVRSRRPAARRPRSPPSAPAARERARPWSGCGSRCPPLELGWLRELILRASIFYCASARAEYIGFMTKTNRTAAPQIINTLIAAEVDGERATDCRRVLRGERQTLVVCARQMDDALRAARLRPDSESARHAVSQARARLSAAMDEAIRVARMWGVEI
jgi:hypothetical protein